METIDKIAEKVIALHKVMKNDKSRGNWMDRWYEAYYFIIPNKDNVYDWQSSPGGERKYGPLYDSSAIHFNELLASALHSMLTNPSSQWFELTTGNRDIDKIPEVKLYLQELVRKIHNVLNNSNFHSEIHEIFLDLGAPGTSVLLIDEDDTEVVRFKAEPIYKYYLRENFKGVVDTVSTELKLSVRQAVQKYGEEVFGDKLKELMEKPEEEIIIIHMLMPREDAKFGRMDPSNKAIASYHVWEAGKKTLRNSGFDKWPLATPRWMKISGETYGRSAGMKSLPDIKMVNAMMKTTIRAAQKVVDPPLMVPDDGLLGKVNSAPGGLNSYRAGTADRIFPLETKGNVGLGLEMVNDTRDRIKQNFFIDQLQLREGPQMTATEVNQRTEEHLRLLGPILGRLNSELLKPLIARIIDIFKKQKGIMPPNMPQELATANVEVYFSSQIARAQKMSEVTNLDVFMGALGGYAQLDPSVLQLVNPERYTRLRAEMQGIPEEILTTTSELKEKQEAQAAQEAKMEQQQDAMMEAETANKAAPAMAIQQGQ